MSERSRLFLTQFIQEEIYKIDQSKSTATSTEVANEPVAEYGVKSITVATQPLKNDKDRELLIKILDSVGVTFEDIDLVEIDSSQPIDANNLDNGNSSILLAFGTSVSDSTLYEIYALNDTKVLYADSLDVIGTNKEFKMKLWKALKELF